MFFESIFNVFLGRKLAKAFVYLFIAIFVASDFLLDFNSWIRAGRGVSRSGSGNAMAAAAAAAANPRLRTLRTCSTLMDN